ncbi:MAG: hypothetical protein GTN38_02580 [Candidatus Aenigmarchaeota archaeon]|nr:hypothetical protein [Candidatus Aenigmarchaeota archaeon]NIP40522.1 hypothetical protein [Candidatus Aenigmarchaeota archaeon]NIQ18367.1 hypothetical protein [Candidatus Aenigmarchaeota archaeon]
MKKLLTLAVALIAVLAIGASVMAQQVGAQNQIRSKIHTLGAFGNGLAISEDDPMDFELIRIGMAAIKVELADQEKTVKAGVLHFADEKYRLRDVVIGNGSVTANIYLNDTQVGSLSLDSYPKGEKELWAGTMTLNGKTYNVYLIQGRRVVKAVEKAQKAFEYCRNNPERCRAAMQAIGRNVICDPVTDENCRERIRTFCESNPEDARCKALRLAQCGLNLEDADCRAEIRGVCSNNATETACQRLGEVYNNMVQKRPEILENAPQWFQTVRQRLLQAGGAR